MYCFVHPVLKYWRVTKSLQPTPLGTYECVYLGFHSPDKLFLDPGWGETRWRICTQFYLSFSLLTLRQVKSKACLKTTSGDQSAAQKPLHKAGQFWPKTKKLKMCSQKTIACQGWFDSILCLNSCVAGLSYTTFESLAANCSFSWLLSFSGKMPWRQNSVTSSKITGRFIRQTP